MSDKIIIVGMSRIALDRREQVVVLRAIQATYGHWHDTHGFRWDDQVAKTLNYDICESLGIKANIPMAVQEIPKVKVPK